MLYRLILFPFILLSLIFLSSHAFALDIEETDNPQAYIDYAKTKQRTAPHEAKKALEIAYNLARKQNNRVLIATAVMEQAQTAKLQKNPIEAQQYLIKAESISSPLNNDELSVNVLTNMSTVLRTLGNYEKSIAYSQRALAIAHESREPSLIFKSLQIKGSVLQKMKRYDESIAAYLLAQRYMSGGTTASKLRLLRDTANAYNKLNEYESGIRYYHKAIKYLEDINDYKSMPNTLVELSKTQSKIGMYSESIESAKRAITLSREYKLEDKLLKSLVVLSIVYRKVSSYEDALASGLEALEIYQKNNNYSGIAASANAIGLVYVHLNQSDNAESYFKQVLKLPVKEVNAKYRAAALRNLGKLNATERKYLKALKLSHEAHDIYEQIADRNGEATTQKILGYVYHQMEQIDNAINAYSLSIAISHKNKDVWNEAEGKAQLSAILSSVDIKKSIALAQDSLLLAEDIGAKSVAEQAYSALVLAEEKRENYKQALAYAKRKEALINEIKTDAINKRSAEMHIILDVEKKERAFETLKREKAVISLELDNQDSKLRLLEKEKRINDLQTQNTLIIVSVTIVAAIITLLVIGRVYFNMRYTFIISVSLIIIFLLYSVNSNSADIIKISQGQSSLDVRPKYALAVLNKALEYSVEKYGPYEIQNIKEYLSNDVKRWEVFDGKHINLTMAMTSADWEYLTLPIRIPIRRGIGSYRLLAINENNRQVFTNITSAYQLKSLTVGLQEEWIMNELFEEEGFKIVESSTYDGVFRMLNKNRFDFIPRGINEIYDELSLRKKDLKKLTIEPNIAIYLPQPYYIFVSPKFPRIAERIEFGLELMVAEGLLKKMFEEHYNEFIKRADLANRTIIHLGNKYLTKKTPTERKELWLKFDFEKDLIKTINN